MFLCNSNLIEAADILEDYGCIRKTAINGFKLASDQFMKRFFYRNVAYFKEAAEYIQYSAAQRN